jgi:eukaryotic-like serine/threonine-protein kinase
VDRPKPGNDPDLAHATADTRRLGDPNFDASPAVPVIPRGTQVGRFLILEPLGQGGMGMVYGAYDSQLDRKIALKFLAAAADGSSPTDAATGRLQREAQAMARLSHPNVVPIYDVGTFENRVFLAIEYIEGVTLRDWLKSNPHRSWREVLRVFIEAGRGLAAAHEAGIVHRDFKPANVLIGKDGRVRVTDFGLARAAGSLGDKPPTIPARPETDSPSGLLNTPLTQAGAVVGTAGYAAPEQLFSSFVDARTDQFSFSVSLYEGLYGERPFSGNNLHAYATSLTVDSIPAPPKEAKVPLWLRRIVLRGLQANKDRWPSMGAMLDALAKDPDEERRRRLKWAGGVGAAALLGTLAAVGLWRGATAGGRRCRGMEKEMAGVWDASRKAAVRAAFLSSGRPYAEDTAELVARRLDDYGRAWVGARVEACEATHVRGEQSEALLDLRMACLDRRSVELRALVDVFAEKASAEVVDKAVEASAKLAPLGACADTQALRLAVPPPADPSTRAKVDELRRRLAEAKALDDAGRYPEGLVIARKVTEDARPLGYAPVLAEGLLEQASLEESSGDAKAAEATLREALMASADAKDDGIAANVWARLLDVVGYRLARPGEALSLRPYAEAALRRSGSDLDAQARFWGSLSSVSFSQGNYDEARQSDERALAIREKSLDADHPDIAASLNNLGGDFYVQGRYDEARQSYERSLAIRQKVLGANHPSVAASLNNLALVFQSQGRYDEARVDLERALAIQEKALGPDHPNVAASLNNLGLVLDAQGRYDEARRNFERALAIRQKAYGPDHPHVASSLSGLGDVCRKLGRYDEARQHYEQALEIRQKVFGPDHADTAAALNNLGLVSWAQGRYAEAERYHQRALAIWEKAVGPNHPDVAWALTGLAEAELSLGRPDGARAAAERAVRLREAGGVAALEIAESRFVLARALWTLDRERPRAVDLAQRAREAFAKAGEGAAKNLTQVETWLAEHHGSVR